MNEIGEGRILIDHQPEPEAGSRIVLTARSCRPTISWTPPATIPDDARATVSLSEIDGEGRLVHFTNASASGDLVLEDDLPAWRRFRADIKIRDEHGPSWSASVEFLSPGDQIPAEWIEIDHGRGVRLEYVSQPGTKARLIVSGHAIVRPLLDGQAVCPSTIIPTRTDLVRSLYRVVDLDDGRSGRRQLDLLLGIGEWSGTVPHPRVCAAVMIGDRVVAHTHAETPVITTGVLHDEPFMREAIYHGHIGSVVDGERARLRSRASLGIAVEAPDPTPPIAAIDAVEMTEQGRVDGVRVFRAPANLAGRSRLQFRPPLPAGTTVRVIHGEQLDARGRVDTTNIALPVDENPGRQIVDHQISGTANEPLESWFAYHGFQYVEVHGVPDEVELGVIALPIRSLIEPISVIRTDDPILARLVDAATRTLLNNVHGVPEDCPTREQSGWTGDSAAVAEFTHASHDMRTLYDKWLGDMATSQRQDGSLPGVVPGLSGWQAPVDPVWGAALPRLLLQHWLNYGDRRVINEHLPVLARWSDALLRWRGPDGTISEAPFSFGHDWLSLDPTPPVLMHTVATIEALEVEARLRLDLGHTSARTDALIKDSALLRRAARDRFVHADGVANGSQGAIGWAFLGDLLTAEEELVAAAALVDDIKSRGGRLSTGFAGTRGVVLALGQRHPGVLRSTLNQRFAPGIGAMLASDVGTLWEAWWQDPTNNGTGSLDHLGLAGPLAGWIWEGIAGVRPIAGGWSEFEISPRLIDTVTHVDWRRRTPLGIASVRIERDGATARISVHVPSGATAVLSGERLTSGTHERLIEVTVDPVPVTAAGLDDWEPPSWISDRRDESGAELLSWSGLSAQMEGLNCAPVSHGQLPGPTWRVIERDMDGLLVATAQPVEAAAPRIGFLFAWVDICNALMEEVPSAELSAKWRDGTVTSSRTRAWQAGWTRATLPIDGNRDGLISLRLRLVPSLGSIAAPSGVMDVGPVGLSPSAPRW